VTFRGYFSLNGSELTNSSRIVAHLGIDMPTQDMGILTGIPAHPLLIESPPGSGEYLPGDTAATGDGYYSSDDFVEYPAGSGDFRIIPLGADECSLTPSPDSPGDFLLPEGAVELPDYPGMYAPFNGARRYDTGLLVVGDMCWQTPAPCGNCRRVLSYDDSWNGLKDYLGDIMYRVELAPWHSTRQPESAEFLGVWVTKVDGLGPVPVQRTITEMIGSGGAAGPHRDTTRKVTFEALVVACTHAGAVYGLNWLACRVRETNDNTDSVLRFFASHPQNTVATTDTLLREAHGVVLTQEVRVTDEIQGGDQKNAQATMFRVTWEFTTTAPYIYMAPIDLSAVWNSIEFQPIQWVHGAQCEQPPNCTPMPVLFSTTCVPEEIDVVVTPPPVCGGCMPVSGIDKYMYHVPAADAPLQCRETAVTMEFVNTGPEPLTLQAYWRVAGTDIRCDDNLWPVQINGLPVNTSITLDGVHSKYWCEFEGRKYRERGIVGTPTGAPWRPPVIDRMGTAYDLVVVASPEALFEVNLQLVDREP